jgi:polyhydroxyalkanoate synthesis regulator phasin
MESNDTETQQKSLPHQAFLASLGALALTLETVSHLTAHLVDRGKQAIANVKKPKLPAKRLARGGRHKGIADTLEIGIEKALSRRDMPRKDQIAGINQQIDKIEAKLTELGKSAPKS